MDNADYEQTMRIHQASDTPFTREQRIALARECVYVARWWRLRGERADAARCLTTAAVKIRLLIRP